MFGDSTVKSEESSAEISNKTNDKFNKLLDFKPGFLDVVSKFVNQIFPKEDVSTNEQSERVQSSDTDETKQSENLVNKISIKFREFSAGILDEASDCKKEEQIIKDSQEEIKKLEEISLPEHMKYYREGLDTEISKNKDIIKLAEDIIDLKNNYNDLMDELSKTNDNIKKQELLDNLDKVKDELTKNEALLKNKIPSYKSDNFGFNFLDVVSKFVNQVFSKEEVSTNEQSERVQSSDTNESKQSEDNKKTTLTLIRPAPRPGPTPAPIRQINDSMENEFIKGNSESHTDEDLSKENDSDLGDSEDEQQTPITISEDEAKQSEDLNKKVPTKSEESPDRESNDEPDLSLKLNTTEPTNVSEENPEVTDNSTEVASEVTSVEQSRDVNEIEVNSPANSKAETKKEHSEDHKPDVSNAPFGGDDNVNDEESSNSSLGNTETKQSEGSINSDVQEIPTITKNENESHSDNNKDGKNKKVIVEEKKSVNNIEYKDSNEETSEGTEITQLETSFQDAQDSTNPNTQTVIDKENNKNNKDEKELIIPSHVPIEQTNEHEEVESVVEEKEVKSSENSFEESSTVVNNILVEEKMSSELSEENITKKVSTPEEIIGDIISMVSTPIINVISERLSLDNSIMVANSDTNLVASANNKSTTLGNDSDSYEVWSKTHYSYSSNSNRSIHIFGLTLGGEYSFKNNKYKVGLAYTLNGGNGSEYISNSISLYSSINNINVKNFRNNFANIIITYGRLNTNKVEKDLIKDKYSTNLVSLNVIFGHNVVLSLNNGIVVPTVGIRYDHISRNAYTNNLFNYSDFSANIITPTIGVSYINKILNDSLTINVGLNLGYGFNPNRKAGVALKITDNGHSKTIGYSNSNALTSNLNFGLAYKVRKNIELSFGGNISYDLGETFNSGFSFGGKYQF